MFRSLGWPEALIILLVVLIIFGAGKLPQIGGAVGKSIREFRKAKDGTEEGEDKDKVKSSETKQLSSGNTKSS